MAKYIIFLVLLLETFCSTTESSRKISASGDPDDIFFEKDSSKPQKKERSFRDGDESSTRSIQNELDEPNLMANNDSKEIPQKKDTGKFDEIGMSSWYGKQFHGKKTASGESYDRFKLTAAHKTLPLGSVVRVRNLENDKEAVVTINDRGPFVEGRIIDVSEKAAEILNMKDSGVAKVGITLVKKGEEKSEDSLQKDEDSEDIDDSSSGSLDDEEEEVVEDSNERPYKLKTDKSPKRKVATKQSPRGYTVQVGVFKEKNRAMKFQESLKGDYKQKVYMYPRQGSFIVQIGDFPNREKAESLRNQLKENGIPAFIPKK
ncbi:MAG: septal ring lytic transglycosylase RlpA family protein [Leptospiraceae bacterium]|nr:septal ring lytic transglycosylase RlpA family protein [Leptospiraceae bacterium]MCK6382454.1 septal ring lytic transglycosylase RlpA family protein [Leptospiraceae bacterium]NUM42792.1 septal ring lytic transglycosylase RlpA family protein [Leptospiraceae bacterium]